MDDHLIDEWVGRAQAEDLQLTGEGGFRLTSGCWSLPWRVRSPITLADKHDPAGKSGGYPRNDTRARPSSRTSARFVIVIPSDREGSFEPVNAVISLVLSGTRSWLTVRPAAVTADRRWAAGAVSVREPRA
ncbi:hypothetical protein ABZX75_33825, partial [Streptomyces sp. NPDC003038]